MKSSSGSVYRIRQDFLAEAFSGKVNRVYENGFDLKTDKQILYFTSDRLRMNPASILLEEVLLKEVKQGTEVALSDKVLRIGPLLLESGPDIETPQPQHLVANAICLTNLKTIKNCLRLFGRKSVISALFANDLDATNKLQQNAKLILHWPTKVIELKQFMGYGEGLTPAFDDFLAGLILTDRFYQLNKLEIPADFLADTGLQTTEQSVQQLQFCLMGKLNMAFEELLADLCQKDLPAALILRIMNYGHSSGADILHGILNHLRNSFMIS